MGEQSATASTRCSVHFNVIYCCSTIQVLFYGSELGVLLILAQLETALKEFFQLREMEVPSSEERSVGRCKRSLLVRFV